MFWFENSRNSLRSITERHRSNHRKTKSRNNRSGCLWGKELGPAGNWDFSLCFLKPHAFMTFIWRIWWHVYTYTMYIIYNNKIHNIHYIYILFWDHHACQSERHDSRSKGPRWEREQEGLGRERPWTTRISHHTVTNMYTYWLHPWHVVVLRPVSKPKPQ